MKKKISYAIGICVILILIFLYSFVDKKYPIYDTDIATENYVPCEDIAGDNVVTQEFVSEVDTIKAVSLKCVVNSADADTTMSYALYDKEDNELERHEIKLGQIKSGKFNDFPLDNINNCQGESYVFKLWNQDKSDSSMSVYKTEDIESGTMVLRVIMHKFDWETFVVVCCFVCYIVFFIRVLYRFFR